MKTFTILAVLTFYFNYVSGIRYDRLPRIYVENGHLKIKAPAGKNIEFEASEGSYIYINNINVLPIISKAYNATKLTENYEHTLSSYNDRLEALEAKGMDPVLIPSNYSAADTFLIASSIHTLSSKIIQINRKIRNITATLSRDDCASNPCKNGGTCYDMYARYFCICTPGWEGTDCSRDINECSRIQGTDLGCQNGGICRNTIGSYMCDCINGFIGLHCTRKSVDCLTAGSELCGQGTCVAQSNEKGFKCLCDPGWTKDSNSEACTKDVNECNQNHPSCAPGVPCINVPGSFYCGPCPAGFTGNGYHCTDINECDRNNGGCSMNPMALCINTHGSRVCGPCPAGYSGDGVTCSYQGVCNVNNGGCHPLATCSNDLGAVQCVCPLGYVGQGVGPNGCSRSTSLINPCSPSPCMNGACSINISQGSYQCSCYRHWRGKNCDVLSADACTPNPCRNNGECQNLSNRIRCKCKAGYTGRYCTTQLQACGGVYRSDNGSFKYPNGEFEAYNHRASCVWSILLNDTTKVISVNITKFDIEDSPACRKDWIEIHDGRNTAAHSLGRFCGNKLPFNGTFTSTQNNLYFWFRSDSRISGGGFEITWTSEKSSCDQYISRSPHGTIKSPGSPGNYPLNRDCYWRLSASFTKRFMLYFASLNIGDNADCNSDYIKFYTSVYLLNEGNLLEKFCNSSSPAPFYTPGSRLTVHFHSDNKDTYPGFQLVYTEVEGVPGCGGTFTKLKGTIHSPRADTNGIMGGLSICEYKIHLKAGIKIKLHFLKFDLGGLPLGCTVNYVEIYEGDRDKSSTAGRYCGSTIPSSYISQGNEVTIVSSFEGGEGKGWTIEYDSVCGKTYTNNTGSFNVSKTALGNEDCVYRIERPPGNIIMLIMKVNMQTDSRYRYIRTLGVNNCPYRFVEIRDGDHENATLINRYCGRETAEITSTHNFLWIRVFYSRTGVRGTNMVEFEYTSIDAGCGGIIRTKMGNIKSPTHSDGSYLSNLNCKWTIIASPQEVIRLTWLTFYIEESSTCSYDNVQVFDNNTELGSGVPMGKFCGFNLPPTLLSSSNIMTITFKTDITVNKDGFLATFVVLQEKDVCEGNYYTPTGVIKSPKFPEPYPSNRECTWTINVPPGQQITLNVTNFDIEFYAGCKYDWLEIRNGGTSSSPLIDKYCGNKIPKLITSHANKFYLHFKADLSRSGTGFRIKWTSAATGCGGLMTSPTGSVISPHYPEPYSRSTECLWKVVVSAGSRIQVVFSDINLENHHKCLADYVELLDGLTLNSKSLGKFCWETPNPIKTSSNELLVKFRSDVAFQGRGFQFHYTTVCHNTVRGFRGVIESPNFPNDYPEDQDCLWEIIVANKNKINITFSHFDMERSSVLNNNACSYDYVEIYYGVLENDYDEKIIYNKYGRYCGTNSPGHITLNSDHAQVKFVSDKLLIGTGFRFEWEIFGCGGILRKKSGIISSPNYPNPYEESMECEWRIEVDFGQSIQIEFHDVDVEKDTSCSFDAVSVYNGMDRSYNLLAKFCKQKQKTVITSTGNYMFILFESDQSYQGKGFKANYSTVPTTCGGQMTATEGYIYSPNYPKNFNTNETCEWLIQVENGHSIDLIFEDIDLWESNNCSQNYVKIFDGPSAAFPVIKSVCGSTTPNETFKSSYNYAFVEFRTPTYFVGKGFKLKYQKSCGSKIYSQSSGILEVKQDDFTDSMTTCSWIIKSLDLTKHVSLTISEISSLYYCDSSDGSIKIYNGEASDSPLISQYCGPGVPSTIVSDGSALTINITSVASFSATYTTLDSQCGGTLKSFEGYFSTPGYPNKYASDMECEWTITVAPGNHVGLSFIRFELLDSKNCNTDYLEIRSHNATGKLLGVYCSNKGPENITHVGSLWLLFKGSKPEKGDTEVTAKGFYGEYYLNMDNELNGTKGEIWSPLYPNTVPDNKKFTWRITVAPKKRILLTFNEFYLDAKDSLYEDEEDCYFVSMEIFDGVDSTAVRFGKYCGLIAPNPIKSSSNIIFIQVEYSNSRLGTKFRLQWEQIDALNPTGVTVQTNMNCGNTTQGTNDIHTLHNFTFTSPGFPGGYEHNLKCEWIFSTIPMNHLMIYFYKIDFAVMKNRYTGLYSSCQVNDRVNIYEKNVLDSDWRKIHTFCKASDIQRPHNPIYTTGLTKVEFISTRYLNGTGFKAKVTEVCGGWLTGPTGYISFDNQSSRGMECQWNITVKSTRTIELTFEEMNIQYDSNKGCNNYLMIRNGKFADSPLLGIGKYCGTTLPEKLRSTGNNLYIKYRGSINIEGFRLKYQEVSANCGGRIELNKYNNFTEISSPNYPNIPTPHTECVWLITAPSGEVLRIDFEERFHLTYKPDCDVEYVELRDGGTEYSSLINRYCKSTPNSQFSTDHMLYVKFFTDTDDPKTGFKAKISMDRCGGTIRGNEGELSYASPGSGHINCTWRIIGPFDHYLQINFTKLDLPICFKDYVLLQNGKKIFEGQRAQNETLGKYCGKSIPPPISSENNEVIVTFVTSSQSKFFLRFKASQTTCGGTLQGDSGIITSPGYPLMNYLNRYCMWNIKVQKGRRITLKFNDVDLGSNSMRYETAIRIFDRMDLHRQDMTIITQANDNNIVESSSNMMSVMFWSASSSPHRGFKATYTSNLPTICEGDFSKENGVISTPPSRNYGYSCDWSHILSNPHKTLAITITLNTNSTGHHICSYSPIYFEISTQISTKKIGQLCSITTKPVTYRSPFPVTDFLATSSKSIATNFTATYVTHDCGGLLREQSGTISSPNYPHKPAKSYECAWLLSVNEGQVINITKFNSNLGNDCEMSFIAIYNGDLPTHPRIGKYCNQNKPEMVISQGRNLWIEYKHDASSSGEGFQLNYEAISTGCGGIFHDKTRNIQSPNFGSGDYPNNAECLWFIESEPGYHIQLVFVERFHLELSNNCENDYIQIWHWVDDKWVSFGKKCGREIPTAIESSGEKMKILFRSNDKIGGRGFKAKWNWLCGGKFIASKTTRYIISPGYPSGYPNNLNCEYILSTSSPNTEAINIQFIDFQLEQGTPECKFDNLTIQGNTGTTSYTSLYSSVYCDDKKPPPLRLKGVVTIKFKTDMWLVKRGFKFEYRDDSCGGEITKETLIEKQVTVFPSGFGISGLRYYQPKLHCIWNITAPEKQVVILTIIDLDLYLIGPMCYSDNLEVYNSLDLKKSNRLAILCGSIHELTEIRSETGKMAVSFDSMPNRVGGFKALVRFTHGPAEGCGGFINLTSSKTIDSPKIANSDCGWSVVADRDFQIEVTVSTFNMKNTCEGNSTCDCLFLEVRDGASSLSEKIDRYCTTTKGQFRIRTSGNTAYVRVFNTGQNNDVTFTLLPLASECGESVLIATKQKKWLHSPNFPLSYPNLLKCSYVITGGGRYDKIALHFEAFNLTDEVSTTADNDNRCPGDYLQIFEDPNANTVNGLGSHVVYSGHTKHTSLLYTDPSGRHIFCGQRDKPFDYYSNGNITLSLVSRSAVPKGQGFSLHYSIAGCNRNYTETNGRINNGNDNTSECTFWIIVPENRTISVYFTSFYMFYTQNCTQSYLEIRDGSPSGTELAKICGYRLPDPLFSLSNKLYFKAVNKRYISRYDILFTSSQNGRGCGGDIFNNKGKIYSPFYPTPFRNDSTCVWRIRVPVSLHVALKFTIFDIQGTCEQTNLKIQTVTDNAENTVELCSSYQTGMIYRSDSYINIIYKSSVHNGGAGWTASFRAVTKDVTDIS